MRCNRCGGMMSCEEFYGHWQHFFGWRCIVCGEIIDRVILENRLKCPSERRITRRIELERLQEKYKQSDEHAFPY